MKIIWRETYRVHFEVNKFASRQRNDNLSLINSTLYNRFLVRRLPLVDSSVSSNVANAVGINLNERIVA